MEAPFHPLLDGGMKGSAPASDVDALATLHALHVHIPGRVTGIAAHYIDVARSLRAPVDSTHPAESVSAVISTMRTQFRRYSVVWVVYCGERHRHATVYRLLANGLLT